MRWIIRITRVALALALAGAVGFGAWWLLVRPDSPLPTQYRPFDPLVVAAPVTWLTPVKLRAATRSEAQCLAALSPATDMTAMAPKVAGPRCGIAPRVSLGRVGDATLAPVETTCAVALRLAMWERHVVQPAAQEILAAGVARIHHQGSYNCRPIRTMSGPSTRMSTHATAEAIDIAGVTLTDGRRLPLLGNYDGDDAGARFYRRLRDGACTWFATVLGPEFNALHADHFHVQSRGRGLCR